MVGPMSPPRSRLRFVQMFVRPKDVRANAQTVLDAIKKANDDKIDFIAFPEMCLPGYLIGDLWERGAFLNECTFWNQRIIEATKGIKPIVLFGTVVTDEKLKGEDGRPRRYNAYICARNGKAIIHPGLGLPFGIKTLLPNYREFDEGRYFFDTRKTALEREVPVSDLLTPLTLELEGGALRMGVLLCEDGWDDDYFTKPSRALCEKGVDLLVNLSCSPYTLGKENKRNRVFGGHAQSGHVPLVYLNAVSLQNIGKTIYTFDGRTTFFTEQGDVCTQLGDFETAELDITYDHQAQCFDTKAKQAPRTLPDPAQIFRALQFGIKNMMTELRCDRVVIGSSGGIDSAVSAAIYSTFLAPENLLLVNMPSRFNSPTTKGASALLAKNLGCLYAEISIQESVDLTQKQMGRLEISDANGKLRKKLELTDFHLENVQARDRSSRVLSALASSFGGVFTCNANKAEMTVGYSTLYGDLGGYLAALGDLWKHQVYELGRYMNEEVFRREVIPSTIFSIVPSAELSAQQDVDQGKGDPLIYPYHDRLFYSWMQSWHQSSPEDCLEWYLAGSLNQKLGLKDVDAYKLFPEPSLFVADLERYWKLFMGMAIAKRIQAPPVLALSSRAYGFDYREAQGAVYFSDRYLELKKKCGI